MKRAFSFVVLILVAKIGISAEEIFNKPIVETRNETIGRTKWYSFGVDQDGDGFADFVINISDTSDVNARLISLLGRAGATVSYDTTDIRFFQHSGDVLNPEDLLEINGTSVLKIFNRKGIFLTEEDRQERLRHEAVTPRN